VTTEEKDMKMPKDVEAKVSMPSDEVIKEAIKLVREGSAIELEWFKKVEVLPHYEGQVGNCRIDSPNGALKYFRERFSQFVKGK